jgi:molybdenum cofactor guanylyltransferase
VTGKAADHSPTPVAAVLAGGASRRMGRAKAVVELGGRPLISYPLRAVKAAGLEPIVVCKPDSELPKLDCRVVREPAEPRHPLAGIVAALRASGGAPVVAVGCDMPFLDSALISWLAALDAPLAVGEAAGRLQPLPGRYPPAVTGELAAALDRALSLRETVTSLGARVLAEFELTRFGDSRWLWFSVNDEADLARAEEALRARRAAPP